MKALRPESLSRLTAEQRVGRVRRARDLAVIHDVGRAVTRQPTSRASGYYGLALRCLN